MAFIYNFIIYSYHLLIRVSVLFKPKARQWVAGRKDVFERLASQVDTSKPVVWFHCASLGEFEQGRPLIEEFAKAFPEYKILLTFFSPSGYEVRKNYTGADYIFYLPIDTRANARKFIKICQPKIVFFIKYEYWFNYLIELKNKRIPVIGVSSIFRPGQRFFKPWGKWQLSMLRSFDHFFVQNVASAQLLEKAGISQFTLSGDTRFDRVAEIAGKAKAFPVIEKFKGDSKVFIAGSTWPADEELLVALIQQEPKKLKFIIAPHEVNPDRIEALMKRLPADSLRFSQLSAENASLTRLLVIDNIGILSHLYQYSSLALIGGGFGVGIHNILEAATFGQPVIFGPNYQKFQEARELIQRKGAFSVRSKNEFLQIVQTLLADEKLLQKTSKICNDYVIEKKGATRKIIEYVTGRDF
jgi:3-deoxy-D-manno-octulosonic-acid transferase